LLTKLTPRQIEIVEYLKRGLTNKQIGKKLGITEGTVKIHLFHVYERLQVSTRTELAWILSNVIHNPQDEDRIDTLQP
jgi:two-component system nitrate/nitrite response regulator NarL